ncbi:MAG TPA: transcription termination factor Rho [Acidimicrobiales bacterium]
MSADTQALERSALERKDRDELHTIATALGGKPGSRAKKADIVNLILELAGVVPSAASAPPSPEESSDQVTDAAEGPAPRTRRPRGRPAAEATDPTDEAAPTDDRSEASDEVDESDDHGNDHDDHDDGHATDDDHQDRPATRNREANTRPPRDRNRGGQRQNQPQNQPQNQGGGAGAARNGQPQGAESAEAGEQGLDGESGNRRRRRRGRDRERGERPDQEQPFQGEPVEVEGLLDLRDEGYGFLRLKGYLPSKDDVYISVKQARQFALRKGDRLTGAARPAGRNEKNPALLRIDTVNGVDPEQAKARPRFEDLTPLFPDERLNLEVAGDQHNMTARIVDLVSPIGKGQRGLIVSPPKAGKTTVMKQIAKSIETNNPEVHLIVLLVDERPEEVTDMKRWVSGEVAASTFDRPAEEHTMVAELVIERAKRMVEEGQDVVIILDGITRLARAYNLAAPATGRIMSGGIDTGALYPPKKFFGAARNIEEGGSLTILATALVETGSRMDEVIFEEFKGTGNMELRLDRKLAERRIYPAIDVEASSTRHEELLFEPKQLQMVWKLRRVLSGLGEGGGGAGLEMLIDRLASFKSNNEFLAEVAKAPSSGA